MPGHEITALSLWKRLLPHSTIHSWQSTRTSQSGVCLLSRLVSWSIPPRNSALRSLRFLSVPPSNCAEIMLPEISMKRDSVRVGIRLNLSSYSPRGRKKVFGRKNGWLRDSRRPTLAAHKSDDFYTVSSGEDSSFYPVSPSPSFHDYLLLSSRIPVGLFAL